MHKESRAVDIEFLDSKDANVAKKFTLRANASQASDIGFIVYQIMIWFIAFVIQNF